jgi:hypothetical protein
MNRIKTTLIALALTATMGCSSIPNPFSPTPTPAPVTPPAPIALPVTAANLQAACSAGNSTDCMIYQAISASCMATGGNVQIAMGCAVMGFAVKTVAPHK